MNAASARGGMCSATCVDKTQSQGRRSVRGSPSVARSAKRTNRCVASSMPSDPSTPVHCTVGATSLKYRPSTRTRPNTQAFWVSLGVLVVSARAVCSSHNCPGRSPSPGRSHWQRARRATRRTQYSCVVQRHLEISCQCHVRSDCESPCRSHPSALGPRTGMIAGPLPCATAVLVPQH